MPRFDANLSMLWPELTDPFERFHAARDAGFRRVEYLFPQQIDTRRLERTLQQLDLELVLFDTDPGDASTGERGCLILPGREADSLRTIQEAVALARRLGTRLINTLAGLRPPELSPETAWQTMVANLRAAAPVAEAAGVQLLIENINPRDIPGYFVNSVDQAARLVAEVDSPAVRLQLDQYHAGMLGQDAAALYAEHAARVAHVQIADVPGRHQPGTGTQPITDFLARLDALGYAGNVGLEYRPDGPTEAALAWLPAAQRG